jgi:hypothetical protein
MAVEAVPPHEAMTLRQHEHPHPALLPLREKVAVVDVEASG